MAQTGWYRDGKELLAEIRNTDLPEGILALWYLGQAGIVVKDGRRIFGVDLYLDDADRRLLPRPFAPEEAGDLFDAVLCTHNHLDHLNLPTLQGIAGAGEKTRFVVPAPHACVLSEAGIPAERILPAEAWKKGSLCGAKLLPVPAAHEEFEYDAAGRYCCLGYVLRLNGATLYHAGDTVEWESMVRDLSPLGIDICCLPINGSDWRRKHRDIIGNLNAREAADIAEEIGADLLIPLHFDMFAGNGENPAHLADYMFRDHPGRKYHIPVPGERILYCKGATDTK